MRNLRVSIDHLGKAFSNHSQTVDNNIAHTRRHHCQILEGQKSDHAFVEDVVLELYRMVQDLDDNVLELSRSQIELTNSLRHRFGHTEDVGNRRDVYGVFTEEVLERQVVLEERIQSQTSTMVKILHFYV